MVILVVMVGMITITTVLIDAETVISNMWGVLVDTIMEIVGVGEVTGGGVGLIGHHGIIGGPVQIIVLIMHQNSVRVCMIINRVLTRNIVTVFEKNLIMYQ